MKINDFTEAKMYLGPLQMSDITMITIAIGAIILIIGFNIGRRFRSNKITNVNVLKAKAIDSNSTNNTSAKIKAASNNTIVNSNSAGGGNKRARNKKRREAQQDFTHKWMIGALKGHTGTVLDMDFSSNGKFLASSAEDCGLASEEHLQNGRSYSSSSSNSSRSNITRGRKTSGYYKASQKMAKSSQHHVASDNRDNKSEEIRTISSNSSTSSDTSLSSSSKGSSDSTWFNSEQRNTRTRRSSKYYSEHQINLQKQPLNNADFSMSGIANIKYEKSFNNQRMNNKKNRKSYVNSDVNITTANNGIRSNNNIVIDKRPMNGNACTEPYSAERTKLSHLSNAELIKKFRKEILTYDELKYYGYPEGNSSYPGRAWFYCRTYSPIPEYLIQNDRKRHNLDVNAREFVPSCYNKSAYEIDSGTGSGESEENSDPEPEREFFSTPSESDEGILCADFKSFIVSKTIRKNAVKKECARCRKIFYTDEEGEHIHVEECLYHWGKFRMTSTYNNKWTCCENSDANSNGCTKAAVHVFNTWEPNYGCYDGFIQTPYPLHTANDGDYGVYGIDCEMCYTTYGLEVTRVTIVDICGAVVYDTFVKPNGKIIDYSTRFSGITEKHMIGVTTTLHDVHQYMMSFISSETILIGHGLENDLRALRIIHSKVIDTSILFKHKYLTNGSDMSPIRLSLKTLVRNELNRSVQDGPHDSTEDASIVVDLVLRKVWNDIFPRLN